MIALKRKSVNRLVFVTLKQRACYEVGAEPRNKIQLNFVFQIVKSTTQLQYAEKE
jgi:hypothetical protein